MLHESILSGLPLKDGEPFLPLGGIRIERLLRQGQLSESFLAYHEGLDIPVVLRAMKPVIRDQLGEQAYKDLVECGRRYARVRHPTVSAIYDMGKYKDFSFSVTEYIAGIPLNERIKDRPFNEAQALKLMVPIAEGLATMWKNDYVHRGVSPLRIIVDNDGVPKLDIVILPRTPLNPLLIEAHAQFMAGFWPPEELRQSPDIDSRSDMFSFGASLYYAVTGRSPFGKGSRTELIARTLTDTPPEPRTLAPELSSELNEFLMRCLERDPKKRFDSTQAFENALEEVQYTCCKPSTARPSSFMPIVEDTQKDRMKAPFAIGDLVGQCRLEKVVGAGAFGVVYKAQHKLLDIPVAVKFLPTELATRNPEYVSLFLREARTAIRIRHKHIIGLYEAGHQNGQYYLIMEFAAGGSVQDRAEQMKGRLPQAEVVRILRETALGLSAAEEMDIVHRDIKPANLMFGSQQEIKIADLGLAKRIARPEGMDSAINASIKAEQLTMLRGDNTIQGTPAYIAPEAAMRPDTVDSRCDLYSLGVTAYQLLTGKLPFEGTEPLQVMMKHLTQPVPPMAQFGATIPAELEAVVMKLMAKKPDDRYQRANELIGALGTLAG
jgi:eukaryotic-like serine/threonine-protein kinase